MTRVSFNMDGLNSIKKALEDNLKTRVGILGSKASELHNSKDSSGKPVNVKLTNADIGAIHEFGSGRIPQRSFLQYPLETYLGKWIRANKDRYYEQLKKGDLRKFYVAMGLEAEKIVDEAFSTSGYGTWAPNAPMTISKKGSSMPLIDTGQLRRSISSKVLNENDK